MNSPHEPFDDKEMEGIVQRSVTLLSGKQDLKPEVVLRALVMSVHQKLSERAEPQPKPNIMDQILQQPGAPPLEFQSQMTPHPFYGPPGRSRPTGVPDPGTFGPQQF